MRCAARHRRLSIWYSLMSNKYCKGIYLNTISLNLFDPQELTIYDKTMNDIFLILISLLNFYSLSATVTICCLFLPKLSIILLHPEKNVRQSMMASKHQSTKGPPSNACNVGIVSNSTKHLASTVVAPPTPQQNGPTSLSCGPQNGKRAGVVIVTDKIPKENGKKIFCIQILWFDWFS